MDKSLVTITYKTASGSKIRVEVSTPVKELLEQSDRQIRSKGGKTGDILTLRHKLMKIC